MANKGSSSTPEIKINFSYESKTSANKKLKERISEVQQVAKGISVGIDFKANSESMKSLKSSLTTVKNNLNKLTLEAFNTSLKEALANSDKIAKNLEKASKAVAKSKLITKTGNTQYDLKAVKEAEKKSIEAIKAQQTAYANMVKASKAELQELAKAEKLAKKESEKALESLAKAQDSFDKKKQKALDAITAKEQKAIEKTTQQQQKALEKQQKSYEKALNSILKQKEALELGTQTKAQKIEFKQADYQRVLDYIAQSGSIAQDTIDELQERIDSLSVETTRQELKELATDLSTLGKNDTNFTNLTKKLGDFESKLSELRRQAFDLNNQEALKKLDELENKIKEVEDVGEELSDGLSVNMNRIKPTINEIEKGFKDVSKSMKETQTVANSFGATFKQIAVTFGLIDVGRTAINSVVNSFKEGISTVVDMDSALADFNKVVDMSSAGLDRVRTSAVAMGQELGSSAVEVVKAQAEFGRVYKDLDTINKMTETAIMGANVMDGLSVDQVAKGLNTVISSLKLSTKDVTTILDSMNEVQNNFNISSTNMMEALSKVGSTAYTAGASLQQLEGYITAITDATGADGGEIGNSWIK